MALGSYLVPTFTSWCFRFYTYKTAMTSLLVPPASVRGMTCLDRAAFTTVVEIPYLMLHDVKLSGIIPNLKKYLFKVRNFKPLQNTNNGIMVYLNPALVKDFESITENDRQKLSGLYDHFGKAKVMLNYENWRTQDILRAVLPEDIDVPTSYSTVGHIIHLNLKDEHLPYKSVIGEVYLDRLKNARTIVNKTNTIDTTFRHFTMEILAGEKDTIATVKENGCTFKFDFAQVYWNSRLCTEHRNLVALMKPGDMLYDMFAGVGPFAIPASRKGVHVYANDLNPESFKWLQTNATVNKATKNFKAFNMDGRDFLRNIVKPDLLNRRTENKAGSEYIVMNLPALAIEFLDVLHGWFDEEEIEKVCSQPPTIHLYCFVRANKGDDVCRLGQSLVEEKLGCTLDSDSLISIHNVRNVAPCKEMICVSFLLTKRILKSEEPAMKRLKIENNGNLFVNNSITDNNGKKQRSAEESKDQECIQSSNSS